MAKRTAELSWMIENDRALDPPQRRPPRPASTPKLSPVRYKASLKELAETSTISGRAVNDIDDGIIQRIRKCLDRANHPNTAEAEAKAAVHLASRLMGQHNLSQAEVLAHESPDTRGRYAGLSTVSIHHVNNLKRVRQQSYISTLCEAMTNFFDCKYYTTTRPSSLELTFYGIADNTVAASMSFEMAYNLIAHWASSYKGVATRNSYCLGASDELRLMALEEKAAEEVAAKSAEADDAIAKLEAEEAERQAQLDRLGYLPGSPSDTYSEVGREDSSGDCGQNGGISDGIHLGGGAYESSDDGIEPDFKVEDKDSVEFVGDLDEEISRLIKAEPEPETLATLYPASSSVPVVQNELEVKPERESKWASHMQLVTFRVTAAKIADEYLQDKGIKLQHRSSRTSIIRDPNAYRQGVKDGKKIDIHRKRIEG